MEGALPRYALWQLVNNKDLKTKSKVYMTIKQAKTQFHAVVTALKKNMKAYYETFHIYAYPSPDSPAAVLEYERLAQERENIWITVVSDASFNPFKKYYIDVMAKSSLSSDAEKIIIDLPSRAWLLWASQRIDRMVEFGFRFGLMGSEVVYEHPYAPLIQACDKNIPFVAYQINFGTIKRNKQSTSTRHVIGTVSYAEGDFIKSQSKRIIARVIDTATKTPFAVYRTAYQSATFQNSLKGKVAYATVDVDENGVCSCDVNYTASYDTLQHRLEYLPVWATDWRNPDFYPSLIKITSTSNISDSSTHKGKAVFNSNDDDLKYAVSMSPAFLEPVLWRYNKQRERIANAPVVPAKRKLASAHLLLLV